MPLSWQRLCRSHYSDRDIGLGAGWFAEALRVIWQDEDATWVLDHEARPVRLPLLAKGELAWQAASGQRLERKADDRMMLTERDGRVWVYAPDGEGQWRPISVQNSLGHQWLFAYDAKRRLARLEVSPARFLEFSYGKTSELRQINLRHGDTRKTLASYDYDGDGNLTSATTDRGTERYGYRGHLLVQRELATGYHFVFHWDGSGPEARCLRTHGEDGHFDFQFDYQPDQFLTRVTDGFGQVQTFHYDEQSRITAREDADGGVHQWAYDPEGRLAAYRLPDGRTTRYGYDALGRGVLEQMPDGRQHKRTFNALGFCVAEQWPDGRTTARRFDPLGRLLQEHRPDGSEWQYHYDGKGWLSETVSNTGEVRRTGFGNNGELLADEHEGALARYAFDDQGRVKGRLVQDLITEYNYRGDQVSAIHQYPEQAPDQRRSRFYQYDNAGRLTGFTAATGEHHGFEYDGLAKPTRYQRPDGHAVYYQYDKAQRLTHVIRADGRKWALGYDSKGQVNTCQAPDGRHIEFRYDAAGDIIHREQAGAWVQHLKRDHGGRILQQTSQGKGRSPVSKQFQYDARGRRTGATCADRRLSWQYDKHGRVTEHSQDQHRVGYGYGPGHQLKSLQLPDGTHIQYDYDRQGRWQGVLVNGKPVLQREFDDQGREQARQAGDHNRQTQVWDRHDCLINRRWQGAESTVRRYSWDAESRLEDFSDTIEGTRTFKRDPQGQLIADNQQTFAYDHGGNRLPADATLQQDRLLKTDTATRKYDALGAETEVRDTHTEHRQFDAEGQLTVVRREGLHVQYGYDALNRRAWRKSEAGTTTYLWHNDVLLGAQSPNGQWQWYIRDPQTDAPLFTLVNGETYYYELDWRNMPVRLWDPKGKRVWQANADAWGACQPEGEVHQPIRLPGQFEDELSGLYNNRFRDYDPKTGRYLTPDPLGIKGGLNSYRYTPNPVDYIDPLGLNTCSASAPGPEDADAGEMAPVTEDTPALQNVEAAGAAAAVARAPVPAPAPTSPGVTRIAVSAAANDAVYASQRSWLARALPIASTAAAFVGGMLYSPSLGGGLEEIAATDGTVYSKHGDELMWNASGADGTQWQTANPQEDMEYRTWLANGGDGSIEEWRANGKPVEVEGVANAVPNNGAVSLSESVVDHANKGDFPPPGNPKKSKLPSTMSGGGHGQDNIEYLEEIGFEYNVEHEFSNGVRVGNVPKHKHKIKRKGTGQSWFPESWTKNDIKEAGEHVIESAPNFSSVPDGVPIYDTYNGVRVGVIKTNGDPATVFPDGSMQPSVEDPSIMETPN